MCGCILVLLGLAAPRLALFLLWLFTDYLEVFPSFLLPLIGFFILPFTTLAAAWSLNTYGDVNGIGLVVVILGILADLGALGGGYRTRRAQ